MNEFSHRKELLDKLNKSRTYNIREFINSLDNWLDNKIGEHNPLMKEWSYTFEEDNNQLKINLLIDIKGE